VDGGLQDLAQQLVGDGEGQTRHGRHVVPEQFMTSVIGSMVTSWRARILAAPRPRGGIPDTPYGRYPSGSW